MAMTPARLFVLLTALFAALAAYFVPRMEASGDEPHYLLIAKSVWLEYDLDLRDNYEREDWREFRGGRTEPHYAAPRKDGRPFPGHAPGLPFFLAPVYGLGGRLACVILLGAMVSGVGALVFRLALFEGLSTNAALFAGLLAAGPPLAAYGLHVYTEAAATLCLVGAYALLRLGRGPVAFGLAAALACVLPFLHPRMALGSVAIAFAALLFRGRGSLNAFFAVTALGVFLYDSFWTGIYGQPTSLGAYGGGVPEDAAFNPVRALIGLLVDRAYGILPYAPVFAALFFIPWPAPDSRDERSARRAEMAFVLAILLPALFWRMWWGGQSPPSRLIAPMTPFLALWVAQIFAKSAGPVARRVMVMAAIWSWGLFLFAALQPARLLFINRRVRPTRMWDALWPGGPLDLVWPDLARPAPYDWALGLLWMAALVALTVAARKPRA